MILSTHILQEVQALCDHIWMINEGSMVFSGPLQEFDTYMTPDTVLVSLMAMPTITELTEAPGVTRAESLGGERYRLQLSGELQADKFVELSVAKGWRLTEIHTEKTSLESIFAEFSKKKSI